MISVVGPIASSYVIVVVVVVIIIIDRNEPLSVSYLLRVSRLKFKGTRVLTNERRLSRILGAIPESAAVAVEKFPGWTDDVDRCGAANVDIIIVVLRVMGF